MEEKKKGSKVGLVIVLLLLFLVGGFVGGKYYYDTHNKCGVSDNTKADSDKGKTEEKELDINSRLVQFLYTEVTHDTETNCYAGWEFASSDNNEIIYTKDFVHNDSQTSDIDLKLLARNLNGEKNYVPSSEAPTVSGRRNHQSRYDSSGEIDLGATYYTRKYVEAQYKMLFGKDAKLDTSKPIQMDVFGIEELYYDSKTDNYYSQYIDGGGTCGPGGTSYKISKAIKTDDEIKIYQDVEEISYKEDASGHIDTTDAARQVDAKYKFVYTFKMADDEMYNFVSRTKEK